MTKQRSSAYWAPTLLCPPPVVTFWLRAWLELLSRIQLQN